MTPQLEQDIHDQYLVTGIDCETADDRRLARATLVRNVVRALYDADEQVGLDPADHGSLGEIVDAAEDHLLTVTRHVGTAPAGTP